MILVLALSPSVDIAYEVDRLERGEVHRPRDVARVPGGKAVNAARVAHALGADVRVVAPLGGMSGAWIAERLALEGLAVDAVPIAGSTRTCVAISARDDPSGRSTDVYELATPVTLTEWEGVRAVVRDRARAGRWLLLSGSIPPGVPSGQLARLLLELRRAGVRIAVDGSGAGLRVTAPCAHLVKVNRAEACELLDDELPDAVTAAAALRDEFGVDAVVTDGVRGAAAATASGMQALEAPARTGRFPAGSGDAFLGGLLAGLDRGDAWPLALRLAADAAERNALVLGQGRLGSSS